MSDEGQPELATPAERLALKLQALYDALPEDEQQILARLVRLAIEQAEVEGYRAGGHGSGPDESPSREAATRPAPNPIDEFRVNLDLFLHPDS